MGNEAKSSEVSDMIDQAVSKLAVYALRAGLVEESEYTWAVNTILDVLKLDSYTDPGRDIFLNWVKKKNLLLNGKSSKNFVREYSTRFLVHRWTNCLHAVSYTHLFIGYQNKYFG